MHRHRVPAAERRSVGCHTYATVCVCSCFRPDPCQIVVCNAFNFSTDFGIAQRNCIEMSFEIIGRTVKEYVLRRHTGLVASSLCSPKLAFYDKL